MTSESRRGNAGSIRILVVDDHPQARAGVALILKTDAGCALAGEADDGLDAVGAARSLAPDIVLMDINLPGIDGFEAAQRITEALPKTRVIFISQHDEPAYKRRAVEVNASGYIRKSQLASMLLPAIRVVHEGGRFFPD